MWALLTGIHGTGHRRSFWSAGTGPRRKKTKDRSLANKSPFGNLICGTIRDGEICGIPYYRADYQAVAKNYTDERSCGELEGYRDKYRFTYIICGAAVKKGKRLMGQTMSLAGGTR